MRIGQIYSGWEGNHFMKVQITRLDEDGFFRFTWLAGRGVDEGWVDDSYGPMSNWPEFLKLDESRNIIQILELYGV